MTDYESPPIADVCAALAILGRRFTYEWIYATNATCAADMRRLGYETGTPFAMGRSLVWPCSKRVAGEAG